MNYVHGQEPRLFSMIRRDEEAMKLFQSLIIKNLLNKKFFKI